MENVLQLVQTKLIRTDVQYEGSTKINTSKDVRRAFESVWGDPGELDREYFAVFGLDTKNHLSNIWLAAIGSLNATIVHPREVLREAVETACAAIIIAHNHPSGDPTPSEADLSLTRRLAKSGRTLGIDVFDHIIFGRYDTLSMHEHREKYGDALLINHRIFD